MCTNHGKQFDNMEFNWWKNLQSGNSMFLGTLWNRKVVYKPCQDGIQSQAAHPAQNIEVGGVLFDYH